ncbi:hypothetical protein Tco_0698528 [Tanacetum coccineum]
MFFTQIDVDTVDNAAKDEDLKCWPACYRITRRGESGVRVGRGGRGRRPSEGNVEGANRGAPNFSTIIAQQLQNLLPAMLDQVSNQGNVGNQNGNVVNENVQENVGNVIVNGNREYDSKEGVVVLTRWIKKMEYMHDTSGCSINQKVKIHSQGILSRIRWLKWCELSMRMLSPKSEQISGELTDEAVRKESINKVEKKEEIWGKPSKDKNGNIDENN